MPNGYLPSYPFNYIRGFIHRDYLDNELVIIIIVYLESRIHICCLRLSGSLFHSNGAAEEYECSPYDFSRMRGTVIRHGSQEWRYKVT